MKKKSKSFIHYLFFASFLTMAFFLTSCSMGGSDEDNTEEGAVMTTSSEDDSQKQEMREQSSDIDEMEAKPGGDVADDIAFTLVEQMPIFPGGEEGLIKYLSENIEYPELAKTEGIEGKVLVSFVVQKDGKVDDIVVLEGIGGGCDEEAARVVKEMPNWSPGFEKGKPVKVEYTLPISFDLH